MKRSLLTLPALLALAAGTLLADPVPVLTVQQVDAKDTAGYVAMIAKINALVKARVGIEHYRHVWEGDFAGESSHVVFVVSSYPSAADVYKIDEKLKNYILDLVFASRSPEKFKMESLKPLIAYGASPRASICFIQAAKALAFINGRGYVTPEDIKLIGADILRHRVIVTYEAEAEEITSETIIKQVFDQIEVP